MKVSASSLIKARGDPGSIEYRQLQRWGLAGSSVLGSSVRQRLTAGQEESEPRDSTPFETDVLIKVWVMRVRGSDDKIYLSIHRMARPVPRVGTNL